MKTKFFTLLSLSVLTLIVLMGVVSAAALELDLVSAPSSVVAGEDVIIVFNVSSPGASVNYSALDWSASSTNIGSWKTLPSRNSILMAETHEVSATLSVPLTATVGSTINAEIDLQSETIAEAQLTIPAITIIAPLVPEEILSCAFTAEDAGTDNDDLKLEIKDVTVRGFGDEYEWFPFDEIEVEIEVENDNNDYKMKEIVVEWGLYNTETEEWYIDDEENDFRLSDGDEKSLTVTFTLDDDIDELAEGDYVLYVWANAVLDDDTEEIDICASAYEEVEMQIEDEFVILNDIKYLETASCGTVVELTADVWNIGDEDQEDVFVRVYNEELGINEQIDIGDIDAFEDEGISFLLSIPEDAEEKEYVLSLAVYDEYGDMFENDFDEDRAKFTETIVIEGNCICEPKVTVSADLESEARSGRDLVIRATIVNTGEETSTFEVSLANYINWAVLESVVPESITLEAGESEEVLITLDVNSDVSGNQNFEIVVTEGTNVLSKQVQVDIEQGGFAGLGRITGGLISESNWPIWTIGAVNVILVFIIILVALKISKK